MSLDQLNAMISTIFPQDTFHTMLNASLEQELPKGSFLKYLRLGKGLTQRQVAKKIGVNKVHYIQYEQNVRSIPEYRWKKLEQLFELPIKLI